MFRAARLTLRLMLVLSASFSGAATASAAAVLEQIDMAGQKYVRVRDWARANQLDLTWPQPGKTVRVSNANLSLTLTGDSKLMVVSGISVWLCYPVVIQQDKAFVSVTDLKASILPLFGPPRHPGGVRTIALDPGHGGRDRGYYKGTHFEKNLTLQLAQELRSQLLKAGFKVILTRATDEFVELPDRAALARKRQADLLISLHFNSAGEGSSDARGVETYCLTPVGARSTNAQGAGGNNGPSPGNLLNDRNLVLAYLLQRSVVKQLGLEDRAVRRARFEVLRLAEMPAALVEGGFLSNPQEGNRIAEPAFRRKLAKAITDGVLAYKRSVEPHPVATAN